MNEDNSINFLDNDGTWHIVPLTSVLAVSYHPDGRTHVCLATGESLEVDPDCAERLARGLRDVELSAAERAKRKQQSAVDHLVSVGVLR